jgi:hypothetical protein
MSVANGPPNFYFILFLEQKKHRLKALIEDTVTTTQAGPPFFTAQTTEIPSGIHAF